MAFTIFELVPSWYKLRSWLSPKVILSEPVPVLSPKIKFPELGVILPVTFKPVLVVANFVLPAKHRRAAPLGAKDAPLLPLPSDNTIEFTLVMYKCPPVFLI